MTITIKTQCSTPSNIDNNDNYESRNGHNDHNENHNDNGDTYDNAVSAASTPAPSTTASLLPQPDQPKILVAQSEGHHVSPDDDEDDYHDGDEDDCHEDDEDDHDHDDFESSIERCPRIL